MDYIQKQVIKLTNEFLADSAEQRILEEVKCQKLRGSLIQQINNINDNSKNIDNFYTEEATAFRITIESGFKNLDNYMPNLIALDKLIDKYSKYLYVINEYTM